LAHPIAIQEAAAKLQKRGHNVFTSLGPKGFRFVIDETHSYTADEMIALANSDKHPGAERKPAGEWKPVREGKVIDGCISALQMVDSADNVHYGIGWWSAQTHVWNITARPQHDGDLTVVAWLALP
jgi:hypothetical protein